MISRNQAASAWHVSHSELCVAAGQVFTHVAGEHATENVVSATNSRADDHCHLPVVKKLGSWLRMCNERDGVNGDEVHAYPEDGHRRVHM
jgi:hypothetical protein